MGALRIERDGDLLRVTLARPETRNAFDAELIAELSEAFVDVGKARAVLLAGDGPSFCAGADVEWMRASVDLDFDANVADANALRGMLEAIDRCPAPVVARVQGHALGGGAGLVACADIAIADQNAVFAFSEVKLGIIPAVISPFALAKIGPSWARRYFPTGERFGAGPRCASASSTRSPTDLDAAVERVLSELRRPARGRRGREAARPRPPGRARDRAPHRRAADERRGSGGVCGVPGAAPAGLAQAICQRGWTVIAPPATDRVASRKLVVRRAVTVTVKRPSERVFTRLTGGPGAAVDLPLEPHLAQAATKPRSCTGSFASARGRAVGRD